MIAPDNKFWTSYMTCKLLTTLVLVAQSVNAGIVTRTRCIDCTSYSVDEEPIGDERMYVSQEKKHSTNNATTKTIFSSMSDAENGNIEAYTEDGTKFDSFGQLHTKKQIGYRRWDGNEKSLNKHSPKPMPVSNENRYLTLVARQQYPLDPEFGAFYIQRKLWYIPLYFSVGFALYLWGLLIKSLSRHRVFYPPIPSPLPPPPVAIAPRRASNDFELLRYISSALENTYL